MEHLRSSERCMHRVRFPWLTVARDPSYNLFASDYGETQSCAVMMHQRQPDA